MSQQQWDAFMKFAGLFAETVDLDVEEYNYKLALAERLKRTRQAYLQKEPDWFESLYKDIASANLIDQYFMMRLVTMGRSEPEDLRRAMDVLWIDEAAPKDLDKFAEVLRPYSPDRFTPGAITMFGSILLMARDPFAYPP